MADLKRLSQILQETYRPRIEKMLSDPILGRFLTEEQREAIRRDGLEYTARLAENKQTHERMIASAFSWTPLPRLAQLHSPDDGEIYTRCKGCDYGGYEGEEPEWPCRTWLMLKEFFEKD